MDAQLTTFLNLILFILPAYFANATPVVLHGKLPMDFNRSFFDSKRLLGDGKTWVGFFVGIIAGTLVGFIEASAAIGNFLGYTKEEFIAVAFLLSLGTMVGDAFGSFIKRRLSVERGKPFWILDQLLFLIFAFLFVKVFLFLPVFITAVGFAALLLLTYVLHPVMNFIANRLGLKSVPW